MGASFSSLALYHACPLKYRYLEVDHLDEPATPPEWRRAPARIAETVASELDRRLGAGVHAALLRWQRRVDGGAPPRAADLLAVVREEADGRGLAGKEFDGAMTRMAAGLGAYAEGPWPKRTTLFLEQAVRHVIQDADGFAIELKLRVDRVVRYQRRVAILDFKTVTPHAFEMAIDEWQLRTYVMAAPELLGLDPSQVRLFLIDLRSGAEAPVASGLAALAGARRELLRAGRGIVAGAFGVDGVPERPCWDCGFRLACPSSLAPDPPHAH
ncbi:MAG: PD-(D/E)XK nuclease family protein [Candidatus Dormiibacterota bacterium]